MVKFGCFKFQKMIYEKRFNNDFDTVLLKIYLGYLGQKKSLVESYNKRFKTYTNCVDCSLLTVFSLLILIAIETVY